MSKGSKRRPVRVSKLEEDLRWELLSRKTSKERKDEIIKILDSDKFRKSLSR